MVLAGAAAASGFKCETTKFDRWSLISEEPQTKRRRRAREKRAHGFHAALRSSLPLLLLQDDSVPLGSALFHPSRERGVLLPLACLCQCES